IAEDKPGVTMRRGANYSTWWNGGLRTTVYFHNMIGLLTETIGNPTPMEIPFLPNRQLPHGDLPAPIAPQRWHFRNSIDYSVTANYAVLDYTSRNREHVLYHIYEMGRDAIQAGSQDSWTVYPQRIEAVRTAMESDRKEAGGSAVMSPGGLSRSAPNAEESQRYYQMLRDSALRDPRGYILPADQPDSPTATKFVNALLETGVTVHRATAPFSVNGKSYPAGSYVVKTAQAFRPHVLDMFEPQDHPNDFLYPGGPPIPPYDAAGWTLAYQMGVQFDRILEGFDGPLERIEAWNVQPPAGTVAAGNATGYLLSPRYNDAFRAVSRLLAGREEVHRLTGAWEQDGKRYEAGTFYIPAKGSTRPQLEQLARELGISFDAATSRPAGEMVRLRQPRIALWDRYGGSMPSGWTRWILEQYEIPFDVIYPGQLDAGNLRRRYDVIVFPDGAIPRAGPEDPRATSFNRMPEANSIPAEYRNRLGNVTVERTVPKLREFLQAGGRIVTIGSSTSLASHLGLPISDKLVTADGKPLPREQYYIPGSVLQARVDNSQPAAFGMDERVDVFFDNSPVFTLGPDAEAQGIRRIAWYDGPEPLRSGWAWGQNHLEEGAAIVKAPVGRGTLYLFGPEVLYRAQPHGTFKFFFNALYPAAGE
ncbi:MAG TPA: hypothetical protein VGR27_09575, partial [Longimicrobiaceae bacterium]|nr:hypothetical protein [Longimicrobiaceae bacterium]